MRVVITAGSPGKEHRGGDVQVRRRSDRRRRAVALPSALLPPIMLWSQFGTGILRDDAPSSRALSARLHDAEARRRLEAIIHPTFRPWRQLANGAPAPSIRPFVVGSPSLQAGLEEMVDTVVVLLGTNHQLQRLITRTGLAPEERLRIAAQMPLSEKEARAAHVISTEKPLHAVREEVCKLYEELLAEEGIERDGPTS